MAGCKSFQRFLNKHNTTVNHDVFTPLYQLFFGNFQFNNYIPDVDATIFTRFGTQAGSFRGYNPKKPGRNSHHPLLAFIEEAKMVANFWLRDGNAYSSNNFQGFLSNTI